MKIKLINKSYEEVMALPKEKPLKPRKQSMFWRTLLKVLSEIDLKKAHFTYTEKDMDKLRKGEPCLYLMNHSSFIDLKIASSLIYPKPFNIVCTSDGFVGKNRLMQRLGCIPTRKFITDTNLVRTMMYATKNLYSSVLMYPEASYSFDGTATPLPEGLGKCIKLLNVPVVMIKTYGAFTRDPLYNGLQIRNVDVSAQISCILTAKETQEKSPEEINSILAEYFAFDQFKWQQENGIVADESFRADGLNRVLYKCPDCGHEGRMKGKGTRLVCRDCGREYTLTKNGFIEAVKGEARFNHIPDWYRWQRECVRKELEEGTYRMELPVDICMMVDTKAIYKVGSGTLTHSKDGFRLVGCDGKLDYVHKPTLSYSLYSDFFWYEIGDMICIGNTKALFYCFPKTDDDVVAKARLAAEELFKIVSSERKQTLSE